LSKTFSEKALHMTTSDTDNTPNFGQPEVRESLPVMPCHPAEDGGVTEPAPHLMRGRLARGSTPSTPNGEIRPRQRRKESRRRSIKKFFRVTPEEDAVILSNAADAGMEQASYMRIQCIGKSKVRRYRRVRADWDELRRLMGVINRAGNSVNQIARHLNMGGTFSNAVNGALAEIEKACAAVREVLRQS
jgi:hypothetical protein